MFGPEYQKINSVYKRDERGRFLMGEWATPEFEYLQNSSWTWTEKVDGTNIRVHWNGESVTIGGRTDNAQVPTFLIAEMFWLTNPALWRAAFPGSDNATIYGEGYGPKIQSGGHYGDKVSFVAFDVRCGDWWLGDDDVEDVTSKLGIETVPHVADRSLNDRIAIVRGGDIVSHWPGARIEGYVGRPSTPLYNRRGERIIVKVKVKDFAS